MIRLLCGAAGFLIAVGVRPIVGDTATALIAAGLIGLIASFCIGHKIVAGRWPSLD
jgi:hypothetical protein